MNRNLGARALTGLMFALLAFMTGCASAPAVKEDSTFGDVPGWYLQPAEGAKDGEICGVGNYRAGDLDFARIQAVTNARADLSSSLRAKVDQAVKNTMSQVAKSTPGADLPPVDQVAEAFRQSLASDALVGAGVKDTYISKNGTVYVRVAISKDSIERSLRETLSEAVTRQMRAHAQEVEDGFRRQLDSLPWNAR